MDPRHYFRQKGADAEKVILNLATKTFFTDWCYPNPMRLDGKELCDCLVVFDDTALIWQVPTQTTRIKIRVIAVIYGRRS